jgi:hypothetical protein
MVGHVREMDSAKRSESLGDFRAKNAAVILQNISLGGVCLETDKPLEPGNIMRLEFTLPSHGMLATFAEVCWISGGKKGMRFLALPEKGIVHLRNYITHENVVNKMQSMEHLKK